MIDSLLNFSCIFVAVHISLGLIVKDIFNNIDINQRAFLYLTNFPKIADVFHFKYLNTSHGPVIDLTCESSSETSSIELNKQSCSPLLREDCTGHENYQKNNTSDSSLAFENNTTHQQPLQFINSYYYVTHLVKEKYLRQYERAPQVFECVEEGFVHSFTRKKLLS